MAIDLTEAEIGSYFEALDALRESGETNMFGAPRWLQDTYDLDRKSACSIFEAWTKSFQSKHGWTFEA